MTLTQRVTRNLRVARTQRKLSQQELAEKAGISISYVSMLERGQRTPPLETLEVGLIRSGGQLDYAAFLTVNIASNSAGLR
jgi:predicted transcriptional regulator